MDKQEMMKGEELGRVCGTMPSSEKRFNVGTGFICTTRMHMSSSEKRFNSVLRGPVCDDSPATSDPSAYKHE